MGFLCFLCPVIRCQRLLLTVQSKQIQWSVFYYIGFNTRFFCSLRHYHRSGNLDFFHFSFCRFLFHPVFTRQDRVHPSILCQTDFIMYFYAGISFRKDFSSFRKNIIITGQCMDQHLRSSLYFFTSITPFTI